MNYDHLMYVVAVCDLVKSMVKRIVGRRVGKKAVWQIWNEYKLLTV